jgi:branched-chain amino acid transport system ATP-binding protein
MLTVDRLHVNLGGVPILRGLSFHVSRGTTAAIVGRNGAGKTTTLRAIMGLVPASGGTISLDGRPLTALPPHRRPHVGIGYAPEDRQMIAALTVEDNLLLPAQACEFGRARTATRLDQVYAILPELRGWRTRFAGTLSGGQQRLVALGRAAMTASRLLILDEPFQGIAPALAARYAKVLEALRTSDADLSIFIAESNLGPIAALAETTYTLERGQLTEPAPPPT